ncbi:hypothetical protein D6779_05110 [Candidatus Parcubacteria bacterium]|nr:MAG: hypothetical protein D6779_05110 [Candidatus Parcubacteria bacterium]
MRIPNQSPDNFAEWGRF